MYLVKRVEQEVIVVCEESSETPYLTAPTGVHPGALGLAGLYPATPGRNLEKSNGIMATPEKLIKNPSGFSKCYQQPRQNVSITLMHPGDLV